MKSSKSKSKLDAHPNYITLPSGETVPTQPEWTPRELAAKKRHEALAQGRYGSGKATTRVNWAECLARYMARKSEEE